MDAASGGLKLLILGEVEICLCIVDPTITTCILLLLFNTSFYSAQMSYLTFHGF